MAFVVGLFITAELSCSADPEMSSPGAISYSLNNSAVVSRLLGTWLSMLTYKSLPEEMHEGTAKDLYALLFQCWMVTEYHHDSEIITRNGVKNIIKQVKQYVDLNDPMSLDPLYEGDRLGAKGRMRAESEPLVHCEEIFEDKQNYHRLVAEFLQWRERQEQKTVGQ